MNGWARLQVLIIHSGCHDQICSALPLNGGPSSDLARVGALVAGVYRCFLFVVTFGLAATPYPPYPKVPAAPYAAPAPTVGRG